VGGGGGRGKYEGVNWREEGGVRKVKLGGRGEQGGRVRGVGGMGVRGVGVVEMRVVVRGEKEGEGEGGGNGRGKGRVGDRSGVRNAGGRGVRGCGWYLMGD